MKKILFTSLLSLSLSNVFADCSGTSPVCVCATPCHQTSEIAQGYHYLLNNDFDSASTFFVTYLQNEFEKKPFILNDDLGAALAGSLIALAQKGAEREVFEAIGRFIVNLTINDTDETLENFDVDDESEWDNLNYYLQKNYGIEKEQLMPLIDSIKDEDLKNFILEMYLN